MRRRIIAGVCESTLLLPSWYFFSALGVKQAGIAGPYQWIEPFLESASEKSLLDLGYMIYFGPAFAICMNLLAGVRIRIRSMAGWLRIIIFQENSANNTAVVLQSALLLLLMCAYALIVLYRY